MRKSKNIVQKSKNIVKTKLGNDAFATEGRRPLIPQKRKSTVNPISIKIESPERVWHHFYLLAAQRSFIYYIRNRFNSAKQKFCNIFKDKPTNILNHSRNLKTAKLISEVMKPKLNKRYPMNLDGLF